MAFLLLAVVWVLLISTSILRFIRSRWGAEKFCPPPSRQTAIRIVVALYLELAIAALLLLAVVLLEFPAWCALIPLLLSALKSCFLTWFYPPNKMTRPLFLIGPRGSGKTKVAHLLAERLNCPWRDTDAVLSERQGKSIREIFAKEGEAAFRRYETEVLAELCQGPPRVIATGGGIVTVPANRELLRASGHVIWLTATPEVLW